jgi:hypothetical protein
LLVHSHYLCQAAAGLPNLTMCRTDVCLVDSAFHTTSSVGIICDIAQLIKHVSALQ